MKVGLRSMTHFYLTPSFSRCETHKRVAKMTSNDSLDLNTSLQQEKDKNSFLIDKTIKFKEQNACLEKKSRSERNFEYDDFKS